MFPSDYNNNLKSLVRESFLAAGTEQRLSNTNYPHYISNVTTSLISFDPGGLTVGQAFNGRRKKTKKDSLQGEIRSNSKTKAD